MSDDGDFWSTYGDYVAPLVGAVAGRQLGKAAAGKTGKLAKNGSLTAKQLKARRTTNALTAGGAAGAYALNGAATGNETVRQTLNKVLEAKEAAGASDPEGSSALATAGYLGAGALLGAGARGYYNKVGKPLMRGKPPGPAKVMESAKRVGAYGAGAVASGAVGAHYDPRGRK